MQSKSIAAFKFRQKESFQECVKAVIKLDQGQGSHVYLGVMKSDKNVAVRVYLLLLEFMFSSLSFLSFGGRAPVASYLPKHICNFTPYQMVQMVNQ